MRSFADENFPGPVVRELRALGHDVSYARETMRGAADREVLQAVREQGRILLTLDKDFGHLSIGARTPGTWGVVLFRLGGASAAEDNARMIRVLQGRTDWAGQFSVVTDAHVRLRPIPSAPQAD